MRKNLRIPIILAALLITVYYLVFERTQITTSNNPTQETVKSAVPQAVEKIPKVITPEAHRKKACNEELLEKISGKCNRKCVLDHIKNKDPEVFEYFNEGGLNSIDSKNALKQKYKSKLTRFYLSEYFMLEDSQSEKILRELSQEDKNNAFPAFFHAVRLMYLQKPSEAMAVLREALTRNSYKHYVPDLQGRLKKLTVHDEQLYARAILMSDTELQLSSPFQMDILHLLGEDLYLEVGRKLVKDAELNEGRNAGLQWSLTDLSFGREIIDEFHPKEASDLDKLHEVAVKEIDLYEDYDCNEKSFHDHMLKQQERFK